MDTKLRQLSETFTKIERSFFIFGVAFLKTNTYYRFDDYGKPCPPKTFFTKQPVQPLAGGYYDYTRKSYFFFTNKVFNSYDTKYFRFVFERLPLLKYKSFTSKTLTSEELKYLGIDDDLV